MSDLFSVARLAIGILGLLYCFYLIDGGYGHATAGRWPDAGRLWLSALVMAIAMFAS